MTQGLSLADLTAVDAHRRGHFLLSSGLHSADYLQCALFLASPRRAAATGAALASAVAAAAPAPPQLVISPALGGVIIGHEVARALDLPFLFAERSGGAMALRRGFGVAPGQRVVVVEDVVTTGRSTREVVGLVETGGGQVVAVAAIVDRSGSANPFSPVPFAALLAVSFPTWPVAECPLCRDGVPLDKPGSRPVSR